MQLTFLEKDYTGKRHFSAWLFIQIPEVHARYSAFKVHFAICHECRVEGYFQLS
jgi:hypothetical protein